MDLQQMLDGLNAIQHHTQNTKVFVKINNKKLSKDLDSASREIMSYKLDMIVNKYYNRLGEFINKLPKDFNSKLKKELECIKNDIHNKLSDEVINNMEILYDIPYYGNISEVECIMNETIISVEL